MSNFELNNKSDTPDVKKEIDPNLGDKINALQENQDRQKERSVEERIDETFGDLEGKKFEEGDSIDFMYMSEDGTKSSCSFNIENQTIAYKGENYEVKLPSGASLNSVEFKNGEVVMKGSIGFFSGEGKIPNRLMLESLGKVFNTGNTKIVSSDGDITEINKAT